MVKQCLYLLLHHSSYALFFSQQLHTQYGMKKHDYSRAIFILVDTLNNNNISYNKKIYNKKRKIILYYTGKRSFTICM